MSPAPKWTPETKRFVFVACVILLGIAVWRFSVVLAPLIVAVIIAYLLNPSVRWLTRRTPLQRNMAAAFVYIVFLLILVIIPSVGGPLIVQQIQQLDFDVEELSALDEPLNNNLSIIGYNVDLGSVVSQITGSFGQIFSPAASLVADVVLGTFKGFIWAIFIIVVGYYLLSDANRFSDWVDSWIPPDYFEESKQLRKALDGVWKSYFIGQLTLAIIVGFTIGIVTALLGMESAVLLGIVAGLLELIPNWGYGISGTIGVLFAFFQGSTYIPLPAWAFALIVAGFYFLMWQIDTNYLVPRIIGHRLQLSPAIIIVGIIAGASVGGAIGLLLAAPTIASVRVIGSYIYRRLLDLEPYVITNNQRPSSSQNQLDTSDEPVSSEKPEANEEKPETEANG